MSRSPRLATRSTPTYHRRRNRDQLQRPTMRPPTRRAVLRTLAASPTLMAGLGAAQPRDAAPTKRGLPMSTPTSTSTATPPISTRPIPSTGEALPVVGLGTWQTFDVGTGAAERAPLAQVLAAFLEGGGRVIDS